MLDLFLNRRAIAFLNWVWNKEACSLASVKSTGINAVLSLTSVVDCETEFHEAELLQKIM